MNGIDGLSNNSQLNSIVEQSKQNGCTNEQIIDSLTAQISNEISTKDQTIIPSTILSDHTKRLFDEANQSKAQWEGSVSALEHELEVMRKWRLVYLRSKKLLQKILFISNFDLF